MLLELVGFRNFNFGSVSVFSRAKTAVSVRFRFFFHEKIHAMRVRFLKIFIGYNPWKSYLNSHWWNFIILSDPNYCDTSVFGPNEALSGLDRLIIHEMIEEPSHLKGMLISLIVVNIQPSTRHYFKVYTVETDPSYCDMCDFHRITL